MCFLKIVTSNLFEFLISVSLTTCRHRNSKILMAPSKGFTIFLCNLDSTMQKLHMKYSKSPMQKNRCRSRAGSLGDILVNSQKAFQGPSLTAKSPYSRTNRSMSICTPGIHGYGGINQARRNSKNDSVNSLGEHFSSLVNLSSQVVIEPHEGF